MKRFVFAYLAGMIASIPAFGMFNSVGASPWRNFNAMMATLRYTLASIIVYYAVIWIVPAAGAAIGAKVGGVRSGLLPIFRRSVVGQVFGSIAVTAMLDLVPAFGATVEGYSVPLQTLTLLVASQIICAFFAVMNG